MECPQGAQASHTNVMLHLKINCPDDFRIAAKSWAGVHRVFMWTPVINKTSSAQMGWTNVFEDLEDQVAVITGGARGLGLSMARALAKWRAKIALLDVLADVEDSAGTLQREFEVECLGVVADVTDDRSVAAAFAEVGRTLGSPSILINAAGIT
ncbi:MAG: family oxidoreductase, partial [Thermomicrobiales bacterium]|nr:family oxidoreductase [Thermomicrobiales bacterium]